METATLNKIDYLEDLVFSLKKKFSQVELFFKESFCINYKISSTSFGKIVNEENGWALRATNSKKSLFISAKGIPCDFSLLPEPANQYIELPNPNLSVIALPEESPVLVNDHQVKFLFIFFASRISVPISLELSDAYTLIYVVSSKGIKGARLHQLAVLRIKLLSPKKQMFSYTFKNAQNIRPMQIIRDIKRKVTSEISAEPFKKRVSVPYVVISPEVSASILSKLSFLFIGEKGYKFLKELDLYSQNKFVASPLVNIVDYADFPGATVRFPFDDEGVSTKKLDIVKKGRFVKLLSPRQFANDSEDYVACMYRESIHDYPTVNSSNFYISPSQLASNPQELVKNVKKGLFISHLTSPVFLSSRSLTFYFKGVGYLIEKGVLTKSVTFTAASEPFLFFKRIVGIGNDLKFFMVGRFFGSPTLLVNKGFTIL